MAKTSFEQIIIKSPFLLTKGFVLGFMSARSKPCKYFFNRKAGIRRDTIAGHLKSFLDFKQFSYLCVEASVADELVEAIEKLESYGLVVADRSAIKSAEFKFSYEVFNPELGDVCREVFENKGSGVEISKHEPKETINKDPKMRTKSSSHTYTLKGKGTVSGNFEGVMDLYLSIKKSNAANFFVCSKIVLT